MRGIPSVKRWLVTTVDGDRTEIWAPTRRLALLNYRFEIGFKPIKTIGLSRRVDRFHRTVNQ